MPNKVTTIVDYQVREALKNLSAVEKGLEGAESSSKSLADALRTAASAAETELNGLRSASAAMATALGDDFVKAKQAAGVSVDDIVLSLRDLGGTFEQIEADAENLADAVKQLDTVRGSIGELGTSARTAGADLDVMRGHADNSRSVLANMVGNSAQDLGALGGLAGTAGVAIGQLAEYATEGNISLSGLAGVAGPMIAVGGAVAGVAYVMNQLQEAAADVRAEIEALRSVQAGVATGDFATAAAALAGQYSNTLPLLQEYGFSSQDLVDTLAGGGDVIEALNVKLDAAAEAYDAVQLAAYNGDAEAQALSDQYGAQTEQLISLIDTLTGAQSKYADVSAEQAATTAFTDQLTAALEASAGALSGMGDNVVIGGYALDEFTQKTIDAKSELIQYVLELNEVPADVKTDLRAAVAAGDIAAINAILSAWAQGVDVPVRIFTVGDAQSALGGAASGSKSLSGRFTPAKVGGGGGGGGGSSGGGGGGGGGGGAAKDPMAEWDAAVQKAYEYGEITLDEYRKYLDGRMNAYDRYSDEYFARWQQIQKLDKEEADAKKKADDEQKKRDDDEAKRAEELKKRQEEQTQRELDRLAIIEGARLAALETFNGAGPMLVVNANTPADTIRHLEDWIRNNGAGTLTQGIANP